MKTWGTAVISRFLTGLMLLALTAGPSFAQTPPEAPSAPARLASGTAPGHEQVHQTLDELQGEGTSRRMHELMGPDADRLIDQFVAGQAMMQTMQGMIDEIAASVITDDEQAMLDMMRRMMSMMENMMGMMQDMMAGHAQGRSPMGMMGDHQAMMQNMMGMMKNMIGMMQNMIGMMSGGRSPMTMTDDQRGQMRGMMQGMMEMMQGMIEMMQRMMSTMQNPQGGGRPAPVPAPAQVPRR